MQESQPSPVHGGQLRQIAERFGIPVKHLLDFSANINPDGPPAGVLSTLRASLDDLSTLTDYPDLQQTSLKQSIAHYAEISTQNIAVANGFVPLLDAVLRSLPIRRFLLPVPAFVEYQKALARARIEVSPYTLSAEDCFIYDPEAMAVGQHDAILLANPQNPSGVCHDGSVIRNIVAKAAERKMYVLLDEAFIDYVPESSLTRETDHFPNLIIFRSVTKFHGIPGLRVAYAVSNPVLSLAIEGNLSPWPITTLASQAVSAALEDQDYAIRSRATNMERRRDLQHKLKALDLTTYPSKANFILFQLPSDVDPIAFWQHMIVEHHIVLRDCTNYQALPPGHLRAAVRTTQENDRLVEALEKSLSWHRSSRL
ncbi:threonine-phosphate decarboxylase [Granulicella sp. dw_53]|uniref:pyridoxal phosphate-dependent aminotransferase n=1 Tax=Granulicella sp. dw_53 TaxID=2719792 RepID=UPI001BD49993|nr:threonine-phosphate decarboxylase [Granulicella sp. dw_53]